MVTRTRATRSSTRSTAAKVEVEEKAVVKAKRVTNKSPAKSRKRMTKTNESAEEEAASIDVTDNAAPQNLDSKRTKSVKPASRSQNQRDSKGAEEEERVPVFAPVTESFSSDDEAPEELSQSAAKQAADELSQELRKAKKSSRRAASKKETDMKDDDDGADENEILGPRKKKKKKVDRQHLPLDMLKEAALARKNLDKAERDKRAKRQEELEAKEAGPKVIGGTDAKSMNDMSLAPRDDNMQLVVTRVVNGKTVFLYQDKNDEDHELEEDLDSYQDDMESNDADMDSHVDSFMDQFFFGNRHRRVNAKKLRVVRPKNRPKSKLHKKKERKAAR